MTVEKPKGSTLFDVLMEMADRDSSIPAVIASDSRLTYGELLRNVREVASRLATCGIGRGDRVGLLAGNCAAWLELTLGASALGAVTVPFSTWSSQRELDFLVADSGIRMLFAVPFFAGQDFTAMLNALAPEALAAKGGSCERYPLLDRIVMLGDAASGRMRCPDFPGAAISVAATDIAPAARADDDALILYTSGSSSRPKAVRLRHGDLVENGFWIGERQGLRPGDRVFLPAPLFWAYGSSNAWPASLTHGAALVLQEKFEPGAALDLIEKNACTAIYTLPSITNALLRQPGFSAARTATLRTGLTLGTPQEFINTSQQLGVASICNIYGLTETYGNCCVTDHRWSLERRSLCQGEPLPGFELRIVDPATGRPQPAGTPGNVEVRGRVTPGYCGSSEQANAAAFSQDGYFLTGDVGYLTAAGEFVFVARSTEMIKKSGVNISPAEVEEALLQHPSVAQAGVVGAFDEKKGQIVFAFVVPRKGTTPSREELASHCRCLLSNYKVPDHFAFLTSLPTTVTGKLLRRELRSTAADLVSQTGG